MKPKYCIPKIIKLIHENGLVDFSANSIMKLYNSKYKNSISTNQIGQIFSQSPQFIKMNFHNNSVYIWRLKEGGL